jgi:hypothetical protein
MRITDMVADPPEVFELPVSVDELELNAGDAVLYYNLDDDLRKDIQDRLGRDAGDFLNFLEPDEIQERTLTLDDWCDAYAVRADLCTGLADLLKRLYFEKCYAKGSALAVFADSTLGLVALGTIADIMPLVDETGCWSATGSRRSGAHGTPGFAFCSSPTEA